MLLKCLKYKIIIKLNKIKLNACKMGKCITEYPILI